MSVDERLRKAMSTLDVAAREQEEQRALRDRHLAETKEKAAAGFQKEATAAARYADHMTELNKRQKEAGGWATEKTLSDKSKVMGFGAAEDETGEAPPFAGQPTANEPPRPVPGWEEPQSQPPPAPVTPPAATPAPEPAAPAPRRRPRHAREERFDDDDFSNNSWMVD